MGFIVVGVVGTAANALILYAMVASGEHRKHVLIFNQNALDLVSCFCLVVTYAVKLGNVDLNGAHGYWLCVMILSVGRSAQPNSRSLSMITSGSSRNVSKTNLKRRKRPEATTRALYRVTRLLFRIL